MDIALLLENYRKRDSNMKNFKRTNCFYVALLFLVSGISAAQEAPKMGEEIYKSACESCHSGGFKGWVTGAPKTGEIEEWKPFIEKGVVIMTENTIKGTDGMDPNGGCKVCNPEQIRAAIDYIISNTQ